MTRTIDATTLRGWLNDGNELAVLDVRDGGPYSRGHILVATSVPRSQFETLVPRLLPRRSVRVVLTDDDGSSLAEPAALLEAHGFRDVHLLRGGNSGWTAAGYRLFSGSNIVSKVFGEIVETRCDTPHVDPGTLAAWMSEGRRCRLFDVRPLAEYRTVSIPGATNCPGMETVLRIPGQLEDATTPVVVNCAGRTRSIIGAQTLREFGIPNPVYALRNGTMGWQLEDLVPLHGRSDSVVEPFGNDLRTARDTARGFAVRNGIRFVDKTTVDEWLADDARTTYVFDVRLTDSFSLGHLPGGLNAPGGQLIQSTDAFAAVRHARMVLVDEHEIQSVMTAHWLARMGWDVHVLSEPGRYLTERGREGARPLVDPDPAVAPIDGEQLRGLVDTGACSVIDVGESYWYRQGRIPGSHWAMRSRLGEALSSFDRSRLIVFCCSTGAQAPFAATDALGLDFRNVGALTGGRPAWSRAGGSLESIGDVDDDLLLSPTDDMWYPPWARAEGAREAMAEYLSWETGLVERLKDEEYLCFSEGFDLA